MSAWQPRTHFEWRQTNDVIPVLILDCIVVTKESYQMFSVPGWQIDSLRPAGLNKTVTSPLGQDSQKGLK